MLLRLQAQRKLSVIPILTSCFNHYWFLHMRYYRNKNGIIISKCIPLHTKQKNERCYFPSLDKRNEKRYLSGSFAVSSGGRYCSNCCCSSFVKCFTNSSKLIISCTQKNDHRMIEKNVQSRTLSW